MKKISKEIWNEIAEKLIEHNPLDTGLHNLGVSLRDEYLRKPVTCHECGDTFHNFKECEDHDCNKRFAKPEIPEKLYYVNDGKKTEWQIAIMKQQNLCLWFPEPTLCFLL